MNKYIYLAVLTAGMCLAGCEEESSSGGNTNNPVQFDELCKNSGGEFDNGVCVCDGVKCDAGDLCNNTTKQCPIHVDPDQFQTACTESGGTPDGSVCKCNGENCAAWQTCVEGKCPVMSKPDFSLMCSYSGGSMSGAVCSCNNVDCEDGALCNMSSGKCSNSGSAVVNPSGNCNGFKRTCINNALGVGTVSDCDNGVEFRRSCNTVSCNEDNTDCGECLNDAKSCINGDDRVGKIISCENGKKKEESCENVSCDGNKCGTCLNYERTCEDEEVKVTVKDKEGNDVEALREIGRIYQCEDGRKGKLVLDCQNRSCYSWRAVWYDDNGDPHFLKDEEKTAAEGYNVYVKAPADKIACGECINFEKKCENDISDFAHMYRCLLGQWNEITSDSDPAAFKANTTNIQLHGYYPITGAVQDFTTQLGAHTEGGKFGVSCNKYGTDWGVCHNSSQICVNEERGKRGYIVKCEHGALADYDDAEPNIACHCQASGNNNGGCSSGRNCYAAQTFATGVKICEPPGSDAWQPD